MASFELIYLCSMFLTYGKGYHITGPNFPTTSNCPTKSELCHHLIFQSTTVLVIFMTCSPKMIMEFPITCKQMRKNVSKQINRWISFPPFSLNPTSPNSLHDSPVDGQMASTNDDGWLWDWKKARSFPGPDRGQHAQRISGASSMECACYCDWTGRLKEKHDVCRC